MAQHTAAMANSIRALAMDAVQQANSGHPGAPMGMAEMAVALWHRHLRHNPRNPHWPNRDRFVLSNGHASMLLYALLHLTGYDLPLDELRRFRQLHGKTPGHPEHGLTPGVETTTGPLGQGLANAVGMALAEALLARRFNRPGHTVVDHFTYVFAGDGCLMEGISHEACSLAGTLKLGKLVVLYDDNGISIDGEVKHWFGDDSARRFAAYGWNVIGPVDGHDVDAVDQALWRARRHGEEGRGGPSLIICKTVIGRGAPTRAGSAKAHGEPLGADEIARTRAALDWPHAPFEIPQPIYDAWSAVGAGSVLERDWRLAFEAYARAHPELAAEFERRSAGALPADLGRRVDEAYAAFGAKAETVATRRASQLALEVLTAALPELLGGSADLTGSNLTQTAHTPALRVQAEASAAAGADEAAGGERGPNAFSAALSQAVGEAVRAVSQHAQQMAAQQGSALGALAVEAVTGTLMDMLKSATQAGSGAAQPAAGRMGLNADGRHINYGVREFGMAAVMNGLALHGGFIPYGGTFLTFSDYSRNAIRMAALMKQRVVHVFTHDSIGLGEDGPTHQAVEHAASLRLIPNLDVWRPCDTQETLAAWVHAIERRDGPSALLLSRQAVPFAPKDARLADIRRGAYVLAEPAEVGARGRLRAVLLATGTEVAIALAAQALLARDGVAVRVVSLPCTSVFDRQDEAYKRALLPDGVPRVAIEAGATDGWWKYGCAAVVGVDRYGESAPAKALYEFFGLTAENLRDTVLAALQRHRR